jgi:predicted ATPase
MFVSLRGKGQYHFVSGNLRTAREDARRVMALAERLGEHDCLIEGHHLNWITLCYTGEFLKAQRHAEEGVARYQRERDHHLTYTYSGHDPGVCCRSFAAMIQGQLGYPERAYASAADALALGEALAHPFSVAIALWNFAMLHQLLREPNAAGAIGERIIRYSNEMVLRSMVPIGKYLSGHALTHQGQLAEGIALMRGGIAELRAMGTGLTLPSLFAALADALARSGKTDEGLAAAAEGLSMAGAGDRFSLPEIHRVKGKLLLDRSARDRGAVESAFRQTIDIARAQDARLLELRAATSLARLWCENSRRGAARELLAPVYQWFTEGFDKPDLIEARALLDEMT